MSRLVRYWAAEAVVGAAVTWLFAHIGDLATFTALAGTGVSMAVTSVILAPFHLFGTVLVLIGNLVFPLTGAQVYEEARGQPISAVVKGENRTGTTWEHTGGRVVENLCSGPLAHVPGCPPTNGPPAEPESPTPDTSPPTDTQTPPTDTPTTPTLPPAPSEVPPTTGPPQPGGPETGPPLPESSP